MENSFSLKSLIEAAKKDLMQASQDDSNPLFFVEKLDIEVAVRITQEAKGGVNIQILELGGGQSSEKANKIKLSLSPILNRDEKRALLQQKNPEIWEQIESASITALTKGDEDLVGEPE